MKKLNKLLKKDEGLNTIGAVVVFIIILGFIYHVIL